MPGPWVLCGDFNATLSYDERNGRNGSPNDIRSFRNFVTSASLIDLPLSGRAFTWSNKRLNPSMARLDRFLLSPDWDKEFPLCIQCSPPSMGSDHCPIVLDSGGFKHGPSFFIFERSWFHNPDFIPFINTSWNSFQCKGNPLDVFIMKLKLLKRMIKWWKKNILGSISSRKADILSKINSFDLLEEQRPLSDSEFIERKSLQSSFSSIIKEEETYWHQRSRIQWLKEGDSNTSFFHKTATFHKKANYITSITHEGRELTREHDISKAFFDYYYSLFGQSNRNLSSIDWSSLYPDQDLNLSSLEEPFSEVEIKNAVFGMNPNKAPGPDGKIKIDFDNVFDSLNWKFIIDLLKARGFGPRWCSWIHNIISSSSCAVLVNGQPTKFFNCKRGLKQGDPLSPMLFNIAVDVLHRMIVNNVDDGLLSSLGIKAPLNQLRTLQYADDTLLFVRSSSNDIRILKTILYIFEEMSGLGINYSKSSLVYFGKTHLKEHSLASSLNCKVDHLPIKYLGLPLKYGKLSKSDWQPILDNLHRKLSTWRKHSLSFGGRLVLLNSVLSSIPLYFMSFYKLPMWLIKEIDKIRRNFLWTGNIDNNAFKCMVSWKRVCLTKTEGGLGVKDLKVFNSSLLAKWLWKCLDRNSTIGAFLHQLYATRNYNIQTSSINTLNSSFWNAIISHNEVFLHNIEWKLGTGDNIRFWEDKWLGANSLASLYPSLYKLSFSTNVSINSQGFFQDNIWHWHPLMKRSITPSSQNDRIHFMNSLQLHHVSTQQDQPRWTLTTSGVFSVKSYYNFQISRGILTPYYKVTWNNIIPSKVRFFMWLLTLNKLHTKDNLLSKGWQGDNICSFCGLTEESRDHLFYSCSLSLHVWRHFTEYYLPFQWPSCFTNLLKSVEQLNGKKGHLWRTILSSVCWHIWLARNKFIFEHTNFSFKSIINLSISGVYDWIGAGSGSVANNLSTWLEEHPISRRST
ncbi:uncharacterized protein LOC109840677 [Asparagus officinalis]|uniref:uncharacterized protein LOC109840677 n=1 Tax=Asparagus officinalis TaxID=4686 RepID=UPI00098E5295|nr:uncharacterized protein LOC109840677 [Asparagus officinalis]